MIEEEWLQPEQGDESRGTKKRRLTIETETAGGRHEGSEIGRRRRRENKGMKLGREEKKMDGWKERKKERKGEKWHVNGRKGEDHERSRLNPSCVSSWLSGFSCFHFQLDPVKVSASLPAEQSDAKLLWQQRAQRTPQPRGEEAWGGYALLHTSWRHPLLFQSLAATNYERVIAIFK